MSANSQPDDVNLAFDDRLAKGEGCSSARGPGHLPVIWDTFDLLDAKSGPEPDDVAGFDRKQISLERS